MALPSLETLSINDLYSERTLKEFNDEVKRKKRNYEKKAQLLSEASAKDEERMQKGMAAAVRYLLYATREEEVAKAIFGMKFNDAPVCDANMLRRYLRLAMPASMVQGEHRRQDRFAITPINDLQDLKDQEDAVIAHYKDYIAQLNAKAAEHREPVVKWTEEEAEEDLGKYRNAPHRRMVYNMMKNVGLTIPDEDHFRPTESEEEMKISSWRLIKKLYQTVINAPRCPVPILVTRVVRHKHQLPTEWFKRKMRREMKDGDVIMSPTFLSTSLRDIDDVWGSYAWDEYDPIPSSRDKYGNRCCIISILVLTGVPMLPLMEIEGNEHNHEMEVLLPPGIELVYCGSDVYEIDDGIEGDVHMETFYAKLPTNKTILDLQQETRAPAAQEAQGGGDPQQLQRRRDEGEQGRPRSRDTSPSGRL